MNKYRRIKKKITDKKWLDKKLNLLLNESESLCSFKKFGCKPFFRGDRKAGYNQKIYDKLYFKNNKHLDFIEKQLRSIANKS